MSLDSQFLQSGSFLATQGQVYISNGIRPLLSTDRINHQIGLVVHDYFSRKPSFFALDSWTQYSIDGLLRTFPSCSSMKASSALSWNWSEPNFKIFKTQFDTLSDHINSGQLVKAVPMSFIHSLDLIDNEKKMKVILNALETVLSNPNLIGYGYWDNNQGVIGLTPEILLRQDGEKYSTVALAGTRPRRGQSDRLPLLQDKKERFEHQVVIDSIKSKLNQIGINEWNQSETQVVQLPTLEHLKTDITFSSKSNSSLSEIVNSLHPTAALGPFPCTDLSMQMFAELPGQSDRNYFGAPLTFVLGEKKAVSIVMIRNIQWGDQGSYIYAGVGQVAQSEWQREWAELVSKINMVKELLLKG